MIHSIAHFNSLCSWSGSTVGEFTEDLHGLGSTVSFGISRNFGSSTATRPGGTPKNMAVQSREEDVISSNEEELVPQKNTDTFRLLVKTANA